MSDDNIELPRVAVLIAVRNEGRHLASTLSALCAQDYPLPCLEVLVIDGGSTDDTARVTRSFFEKLPGLKLVNNPRGLSAAGWNLGLSLSRAPVVSILSGHVQLPPNFYSTALSLLALDRAGVGFRAVPVGEDVLSALIAKAFSSLLGNGGASFMTNKQEGPVESIAFGCYWREELLGIGGFDEQIVRGQDWDLNLRLRASGKTLWYSPVLEARYNTRTSFRGLWKRQYQAGRWKRYIHLKAGKPFLLRHVLPGVFVAVLSLCIAVVPFFPNALAGVLFIVVAHMIASFWQGLTLRLPLRQLGSFWWSMWLIHVGYGAGILAGFAVSPATVADSSKQR